MLGKESLADELRVRTCFEMVINRSRYESNCNLSEGLHMLSPDFNAAIDDCVGGKDVCIWAVFALASVLN